MAGIPISHPGIKTYWHLQSQRRLPTDYEIASTRLLYYRTHGVSVDTPVAAWMHEHRADLDLKCDNWDDFADPATTTYKDYVSARRESEAVIAGALRLAQEEDPDDRQRRYSLLSSVLAPMRYPWHGLQMASAQLAHLAPGSRIAIAALFQTADLLRSVEGITRRVGILLTDDARTLWEDGPFWQPTRAAIERLLVTYRWTECFVALNLVVKPMLDEWLLHHLSDVARIDGDESTRLLLWSLHEDSFWHRAWTIELCARLAKDADNRRALAEFAHRWRTEIEPVQSGFRSLFPDDFAARQAAVNSTQHTLWNAAGIEEN